MAWKIVNKKVFALFVFFCLLVLGGVSFGVYKAVLFAQKKNSSPAQETGAVSWPDASPQEIPAGKEANTEQESAEKKEQTAQEEALVEYENTVYGYKLFFPESWGMENSESASLPSESGEDALPLKSGGYTFWSNYKDINKYDPQSKPDDFRLLSLAVYEDDAADIAAFAGKLGFVAGSTSTSFKSDAGLDGVEYAQPGLAEGEMRICVIYAKEGKFFVFTPAFAANDQASSLIMEKIIRSFAFTE
ncbi:MAG TPA: hypothetical protein PKA31_01375 [Candidatus Moranbacteria bacterium]|nr:hypothetical protein [Candidatus Moranbacteria bacterium]